MMKKKIIVGVTAFTLLAGTGTGVYAYNQKVLANEAAQLEQLRVETLKNAENAVDSLYNSTRTRLAEDIDNKIKSAEAAVGKVEEEKAQYQLSKEISEVKEIAEIQQEVYSTLENEVLVESITDKKLTEINQKLIIIKSINDAIYTHLADYLSEADAQLASIDAALKKIKEAENSLSRETYNSALALVDEVKNEIKKNELKKQLETVNKKIIAMEEEAKRKKEEERIAAEKAEAEKVAALEQSKQQSSSSKQTPSSNSTNSSKSNAQSSTSSSKSNTQSSTSSGKSTSKSNQSNSGSKSSSSTNKPSSSEQKPASKPSGSTGSSSSGGKDWDNIGEQLENHDWNNTGSGEIDKGGNTWDSWE